MNNVDELLKTPEVETAIRAAVEAVAHRIVDQSGVSETIQVLARLAGKPEIKSGAIYTIVQAALLLDVNRSTIDEAIRNGHLKADHVGSENRLRGQFILQWLDEGGKTGRGRVDVRIGEERKRA